MAAQNKAAFVRSLPPTMPAKEVIEKAKVKGIKLSPAYVYVIRSKGSSKGKSAAGRGGKRGRGAGGGAAEKQFTSLVLDLGLHRAQEMLNDVRARIQRAI